MLIVEKLLSHDDLICRTCYWLSADITRVDVRLSLGVFLFVLATGSRPYCRNDDVTVDVNLTWTPPFLITV